MVTAVAAGIIIPNEGITRLEVIDGLVDIEYGVRIVGACIIENGDVIDGDMLIDGMWRILAAVAADAAAAAPALRLRRLPATVAVEATFETGITGALMRELEKASTRLPVGAINIPETRGACETAKSEPDNPVTSVVEDEVRMPGRP